MNEEMMQQEPRNEDAEMQALIAQFWGEDYPGRQEPEGSPEPEEAAVGGDPTVSPAGNMPQEEPQENQYQQMQQMQQYQLDDARRQAVDDFVAQQYQNFPNPYTGEPIETAEDHAAYLYESAKEQLTDIATASGAAPELINNLIEQMIGYHPDIRQAQEEHGRIEEMEEEQQRMQAENFTTNAIKTLQQKYPTAGINGIADLYKTEEGKQALQYWSQGVPLERAYAAAFADKLAQSGNKSAMQQALNQMNSTGHIAQPVNGASNEPVMTAEEMADWKAFYPDLSKEEITKKWKKMR